MMIKLKLFLAVTTAITTISYTAIAQEDDKAFSGWYVGIEGGYNRSRAANEDSIYYGLNLGYRYQTDNNWVLGLEGSFGRTEFNVGNTLVSNSVENDFQWTASALVGYALGEKNLLFSKVGIVGSQFEVEQDTFTFADGTVVGPFEENFHEEGLLLGFGYERSISKSLSFRAGFDYLRFGDSFEEFQPKIGVSLKF